MSNVQRIIIREQFQIFVLILINMVEVLERMGALSLFSVRKGVFLLQGHELEEEDFTWR